MLILVPNLKEKVCLPRLIFVPKILAHKTATFHIQTRCKTFKKTMNTTEYEKGSKKSIIEEYLKFYINRSKKFKDNENDPVLKVVEFLRAELFFIEI